MNYWWVYQGKTFERAFAGGYLWAPSKNIKGGTPFYYWTNVDRCEVGDVIFCHVSGQLVAVATPLRPSYVTPPPDPRDNTDWQGDGWRLDVSFTKIVDPVSFDAAYAATASEMPAGESPFASNGRPNQGYMFKLSEAAGLKLSVLVAHTTAGNILDNMAHWPSNAEPTVSTALSLIAVRIGQAVFRRKLELAWAGRCSVSDTGTRELLRASHIKPWYQSSNSERLDVGNGLLLNAAYDAAFDKGLISFDDHGTMILHPSIKREEARRAGIDPSAKLRFVQPSNLPYLAYHRRLVFRPV